MAWQDDSTTTHYPLPIPRNSKDGVSLQCCTKLARLDQAHTCSHALTAPLHACTHACTHQVNEKEVLQSLASAGITPDVLSKMTAVKLMLSGVKMMDAQKISAHFSCDDSGLDLLQPDSAMKGNSDEASETRVDQIRDDQTSARMRRFERVPYVLQLSEHRVNEHCEQILQRCSSRDNPIDLANRRLGVGSTAPPASPVLKSPILQHEDELPEDDTSRNKLDEALTRADLTGKTLTRAGLVKQPGFIKARQLSAEVQFMIVMVPTHNNKADAYYECCYQ